mmetsp:Transcript_38932/g.116338  ORF Transcript_38932/g.116338 Transcript_38932/m.116338 type:complete len:355 (-) Transcript_38932:315-1379(-)
MPPPYPLRAQRRGIRRDDLDELLQSAGEVGRVQQVAERVSTPASGQRLPVVALPVPRGRQRLAHPVAQAVHGRQDARCQRLRRQVGDLVVQDLQAADLPGGGVHAELQRPPLGAQGPQQHRQEAQGQDGGPRHEGLRAALKALHGRAATHKLRGRQGVVGMAGKTQGVSPVAHPAHRRMLLLLPVPASLARVREHLPREQERLQRLEQLHRSLVLAGKLNQEAVSTGAELVQAVHGRGHVPEECIAFVEAVLLVVFPESQDGNLALLLVVQSLRLLATHMRAQVFHAGLILTGWHKQGNAPGDVQLLLADQLQDLLLLSLLLALSVWRPARVEVQQHLVTEGEGEKSPQLLHVA